MIDFFVYECLGYTWASLVVGHGRTENNQSNPKLNRPFREKTPEIVLSWFLDHHLAVCFFPRPEAAGMAQGWRPAQYIRLGLKL